VSGGGLPNPSLHQVSLPSFNPPKASSYNIIYYVCMSLSSTWIPYILYIYIYMNKKGGRESRGSSSSYFYLLFFFFLFLSVFSLCYVNPEQAMFYLLIAFPSRRQGRKLSQPAFALTCISPQIHVRLSHSIHTGYGKRKSQR